MKLHLLCTSAALAALVAMPAHADMVDEVVVTATRSPVLASKTGQSITVVTADNLKERQTPSVAEVLATTPGVSVTRNGGIGTSTALRIRGAETDHTVVLIDGVKVNDPSAAGAGYDFGDLLTTDIGRIEVLRGAQSTLYGSQAIGGVVNIITAVPTEPFQATAQAEYGSNDTAFLRASAGGTTDRAAWRLSASRYRTDGVSAYRYGKERDGFTQSALSGRVNFIVIPDVNVDLRAAYSRTYYGFDGFPPPLYTFNDTADYGVTKDLIGYAGVNFKTGPIANRIGLGYTTTDRFNGLGKATTLDTQGKTRRLEYQGAADLFAGFKSVFGVEQERSHMESLVPVALPNTATLNSAYAQVHGPLGPLSLTAGIRYDDHDTFGSHTSLQLAGAYSIGDTTLRASFGQGFKAPSLYQLYSSYGNLALQPETADTWEAGVDHTLGPVTLSATYFNRDVTDQIDYVSCTSTSGPICTGRWGYYDNTARAKAKGIELIAVADFDKITVDANYTYTDARNESPGANNGKRQARRPEHTAAVNAAYKASAGWSVGGTVRYVGNSFDNATNTALLKSYTVADVRASYPVSKDLEVYGRVDNLFDASPESVRNYGSLGRTLTAGVRYTF